MQRVDAGYLYELGGAIRAVRLIRYRDFPAYEVWGTLSTARQKTFEFLTGSVYSGSVRNLSVQSGAFLKAIDDILELIVGQKRQQILAADLIELGNAYDRFEPVFSAELSQLPLYLVLPKGAYDVQRLTEFGSYLFPQSVISKSPDALRDINEGAKALAFELWSAAAFHFNRANEAVLRRYYQHCCGTSLPDPPTMGVLLAVLEKSDKADKIIVSALQNIKNFHRNPNAHPGHFIDSDDDAFNLVAAIRSAMSYMLERLPDLTEAIGHIQPPPFELEQDDA